jgi:hypothetical protein
MATMAIIKRYYTVPAKPAYETPITEGFTCDLCGKQTKQKNYYRSADWSEETGTVDRITIERHIEKGVYYGQESPGEEATLIFDLCSSCWDDKLVPFFAMYGGTAPRER